MQRFSLSLSLSSLSLSLIPFASLVLYVQRCRSLQPLSCKPAIMCARLHILVQPAAFTHCSCCSNRTRHDALTHCSCLRKCLLLLQIMPIPSEMVTGPTCTQLLTLNSCRACCASTPPYSACCLDALLLLLNHYSACCLNTLLLLVKPYRACCLDTLLPASMDVS
jgi:hypothetical protein